MLRILGLTVVFFLIMGFLIHNLVYDYKKVRLVPLYYYRYAFYFWGLLFIVSLSLMFIVFNPLIWLALFCYSLGILTGMLATDYKHVRSRLEFEQQIPLTPLWFRALEELDPSIYEIRFGHNPKTNTGMLTFKNKVFPYWLQLLRDQDYFSYVKIKGNVLFGRTYVAEFSPTVMKDALFVDHLIYLMRRNNVTL